MSNTNTDVGNLVSDKDDLDTSNVDIKPMPIEKAEMPDLNRPVKFSATISEISKQSYLKKIEELSTALKEDKELISHWLDLASYHRMAGDYDGAEKIWKYVTVIRPLAYAAYFNLGDLYGFYIKDNIEAEKYFLKALDVEPGSISGYLTVSDFYNEVYTEKAGQAKKILQDGLKQKPNDINLKDALEKLP